MITGMLALAKGVGTVAGKAMQGLGVWLTGERNWWQVGFYSTSVMFALAAAWAGSLSYQVVVIRERCTAQLVTVQAQAAQAEDKAADNARAVQACQTTLTTEVGKRQAIEKVAAAAVAEARASEQRVVRDLQQWQREYRAKPAGCAAALQAMEAACPTLGGY